MNYDKEEHGHHDLHGEKYKNGKGNHTTERDPPVTESLGNWTKVVKLSRKDRANRD
jgi:hypothetical protein